MCQVSFSEPFLLSRVRETKVAVDRIVARTAGGVRGFAAARASRLSRRLRRGAAPRRSRRPASSACGRFPCRPARRGSAAPLLGRRARRHSPRSCSRTGRSPAGPSPPSACRGSGRPSASFMRSASGMVWSCQGASSSSSLAPPIWTPGISAARLLRRQRRGVAVEQAGEEAVQPDALLGGERRVLRHDGSRAAGACGEFIGATLREQCPSAPRSRGGA